MIQLHIQIFETSEISIKNLTLNTQLGGGGGGVGGGEINGPGQLNDTTSCTESLKQVK